LAFSMNASNLMEHINLRQWGRRAVVTSWRPLGSRGIRRLFYVSSKHRRSLLVRNAATLEAPTTTVGPRVSRPDDGHLALLQGLGEVGEIPPRHMPFLLRLAHMR
jgi:hypothetical protein